MTGRPLRILTFTSLFPNPYDPLRGVFIERRLAALARLCEVDVVAPVNLARFPKALWSSSAGRSPLGLPTLHPRFLLVPGWWRGLGGELLFREVYPQIRGHVRAGAHDLVDAHYAFPDGVAALRLARRTGRPLVLSVRGSDVEVLSLDPRRRGAIQDVLRRADAVVAVSDSLRRKVEELGTPAGRVHVIPNGVDTQSYKPASRDEARRALDWAPGMPAILYVGRLSAGKGQLLLVEALAHLRAMGKPRVACYLAGDGPLRASIQQRAAELGLSEDVLVLGAVPPSRLPSLYQAADATCLFSKSEGCPNVVLESLACGAPVVATAVGGVVELVRDGVNGLLIREEDPASAAAAISSALERTWDPERVARASAVRSWDQVAAEQLDVYDEVLARGRAA